MKNDISQNFLEWDRTMYTFLEDMHSAETHVQEGVSSSDISGKVHEIFLSILFQFIETHKIKDKWKYTIEPHIFPFGQQATISSEKLGTSFDFGIYMNEFFLSSHLSSPMYLRNMNDDFWRLLVEMASFGKFEFAENAIPQIEKGSEEEKLMRFNKSQIFRLIRNFIFLETSGGGTIDIGSLEVKWEIGLLWKELISKGSAAFYNMYQIDYSLYRAEYQAQRGREKRSR
jgi:hypothetical protein